MNRKISLMIGIILLAIALIFVMYAFHHPEMSLPLTLRTTFRIYGIYLWLIFQFLLEIPVFSRIFQGLSFRKNLIMVILFLFIAAVFYNMEIKERLTEPEIYNFIRAFIITGGIGIGLENLYHCLKKYKK